MEFEDRNSKELNLDAPDTVTEASLCLYSKDIDIEKLSVLLGCNPTQAYKRGDKVKPGSPPSRTGLWSLDAPKDLYLPSKLVYLIEKTTSDQSVWDNLAAIHDIQLRCAIFLHSWTDGFDLPATLLAEIGRRHWQFGLSVYSAEGDEIVKAFLKTKKDVPGQQDKD